MFVGAARPTVINVPVVGWNKIHPESPGFVMIEFTLLMVAGKGALIVNEPVPLFLKPMYQPPDNVAGVGRFNVPAPAFQTIVLARVASVTTGVLVTAIMFSVVANCPLTVVRPAPAKVAASANEVPAPKVIFSQVPETEVLSER